MAFFISIPKEAIEVKDAKYAQYTGSTVMLLHAKFVQTSYTQLGQCLKLKRVGVFFVY